MSATLRAERGDERLGERIRAARLRAHLSQTALGERIGVSQPTVAHWEKGLHAPKPPHMRAVAAVLSAPELTHYMARPAPAPTQPHDAKRDYLSRPIHHVPVLDWPFAGWALETASARARHHIPAALDAASPFALVCDDIAMARAFPPGSIVVFDGADRSLTDGAYHLMKLGGRFLIRRWREDPDRLETVGDDLGAGAIFPKTRPAAFGRAVMSCQMFDDL